MSVVRVPHRFVDWTKIDPTEVPLIQAIGEGRITLEEVHDMAIAGGAKPSVTLRVTKGKLHVLGAGMRQDVENDEDTAVQRLMDGQVVAVQKYGRMVGRVSERVEAQLKGDDGQLLPDESGSL